jgi:hypothetical protein
VDISVATTLARRPRAAFYKSLARYGDQNDVSHDFAPSDKLNQVWSTAQNKWVVKGSMITIAVLSG